MLEQDSLFVSGQEGYHSYRIPTLLLTRAGVLLAFCEARKNSSADAGEIDIVLKRSHDHGSTWSEMEVITKDGANTVGNPCPVEDRETGDIILLFCQNEGDETEADILAGKGGRRIFVMRSADDGLTWGEPKEITKDVNKPGWTWYAIGPCHGIQLQSGRLIAACNHAVFNPDANWSYPYQTHVIYSDNHGEDWQIGGILPEHTNESTLAELEDGTLYLNMRSYHGENRRAQAYSDDGGMTWSALELNADLVEPVCQASVLKGEGDTLFFSNPASTTREKLTIKKSEDRGKTWDEGIELYSGFSGYSDLAITGDNLILCIYERGQKTYHDEIILARIKIQ